MNKIFKVIYNHAAQRFDVVSELTKSNGKSSSTTDNRIEPSKALLALGVAGAALLGTTDAMAVISVTQPKVGVSGVISGTNAKNNGDAPLYISTPEGNTYGTTVLIGNNTSNKNNGGGSVIIGDSAKGDNLSVVIGRQAKSEGQQDVVIGAGAEQRNTSSTSYSTVIGRGAIVGSNGTVAVAIGYQSLANNSHATTIGANSVANGVAATAIGYKALALGNSGVAVGFGANASGPNSQAIGVNSCATMNSALAFGSTAKAFKEHAVAIGSVANANGTNGAIAIGWTSGTTGESGIAIGPVAGSHGERAVAIGRSATANGTRSTAVGTIARTLGDYSVAMGARANTALTATNSIAMGNVSTVSGSNSISIGPNSNVTGNTSIAVGAGNVVTGNNSGVFGDPSYVSGDGSYSIGNNNTITTRDTFVLGSGINRADDLTSNLSGTVANSVYLGADSEVTAGAAATAGELKANTSAQTTDVATTAGATGTVTTATVGSLTYSGFQGATSVGGVAVGAAGTERRIQSLAAGEISATSTDAINGSQLYATNKVLGNVYNSTTAALGGTVTPTDTAGNFKVSYDLTGNNPSTSGSTGTTYNNVGAALTALSEAVNQPITFTADKGSTTRELGSTLKIVSGSATDTSTDNLLTNVTKDGTIEISFATKPTFTNVTVKDTLDVGPVTIKQTGIDAGNTTITHVAPGKNPTDAVNLSQLNASKSVVTAGNQTSITTSPNADGSTNYKVDVTTGTSSVSDGKAKDAEGNTVAAGKAVANVANGAVATISDVVNTINDVYWNTVAGNVTGTNGEFKSDATAKVKAGDTVTHNAGQNIKIEQTGATFNISTTANVTFTNAVVNSTLSLGDVSDASAPVVNMTAVNASTPKVKNVSAIDVNGSTITHLAHNLPTTVSTGDEATSTKSQAAPTVTDAQKTNAATLGDVLNAGWNLRTADKGPLDFVKPYDTVEFLNGEGTSVVSSTDGSVNKIQYNVNADGKTTEITYVDKDGNTVTKNADGKYSKADGSLYTGPVTSRISAIGPKVNGENATGPINLINGDTTTVTNTGNGIKVEVNTGEIKPEDNGTVTGPRASAIDALKTAQDAFNALPADATEEHKKAAQDKINAAQDAVEKAGNQVATAQNVADAINGSGWKTNSTTATGGATETVVNPGETVNFEAGKNMQVTQKVEKDALTGKETISYTYGTKDDVSFNSVQIGGVTKDGKVENPITINSKVDGDKVVNTISNLTTTLPDPSTVNDGKSGTAPSNPVTTNAATLGDVLNAGWNLQGNGEAKDFVKPYDTVNFANGAGTTAVVTSDGTVSKVTYDVAVDNKTTEITYTNAAGDTLYKQADDTYNTKRDGSGNTVAEDQITGSRVSAILPKTSVNGDEVTGPVNIVNGDTTTVTNTANGIKVEVNTGEIKPEDNGTVTGPRASAIDALKTAQDELAALPKNATEEQKKAAQDKIKAAQDAVEKAGNQVATAQNVADAINGSGWTAAVDKTGTGESTDKGGDSLVNPGDTVKFIAGDNMNITKDGLNYTIATKKDVKFDTVAADKGLTIGSGDNAVNMTPTTTTVANGETKPAVNMNGATLTNISSNLPNTTSVGDKPTTNAPITAQEAQDLANKSGSNAATLGDVLNAGWNLQGNGVAKDFVKPYDTVNFVNGAGTTAEVTSNGQVSNVTYNVAVDDTTTEITYTDAKGNTLYKQADGTYNTARDGKGTTVKAGDVTGSRVSAKTSPLTNNADGTVNTPANPNSLATAGDVANAINNSGFTLTTSASKGEVEGTSNYKVNPGKTVTVDAGKNIKVTQKDGVVSVATKDNVEFSSVKTNKIEAGSVTIDQNGIDAGGKKITNVARGTKGTDAVNLNQLKEVAGDIHNKINRNNKDLRAGIAGANAAAGLPQVYTPGRSMVAASVGAFKGQSALAVGYSRASDNGKLILKLQGNANSRGDVGGSVGMGYQW
ncbi:autotransporter adhesin [[Actinobacillus] rossii]|uniref:Autotransporter adhesin n=1 Tax=[Actinobacillus] rossii TaxID=123820 RepID=A0A380TX58_9PAST|nr:autotransporter adhesin [[Actinobacillus] rossii]